MDKKIDKKYIWAVEDIYQSIEDWEKDYTKAETLCDFSSFRGKLGEANSFYDCMKAEEKACRIIEKLSVYAMMLRDSDTRNSKYDALESKVSTLSVKFGTETSFIAPELTALSNKKLKEYIDNPKLKDYDYSLKCILKDKAHVLSENEEKLLTECSEPFSQFKDIFTKIDNADLPLKSVKDGKNKIPLSHAMYGVIMHGENRELRRKTFKKYYGAYISLMNVISATYIGSVKKDCFYAKAKKYSSALEMALSGEDVSVNVYNNLIKCVDKGIPYLNKYMEEKKKESGYERFHMYDIYAPTVKEADIKLSYDEAYDLVIKGLSVLGKEYADLLKKAHDNRWLDVYESKGKRSGAYSVAVYDTHPYVLLNYEKTTHEVFTIAHEMGHSIHSYFSNKNQPYAKADYKIFVAEVASTVNEVLLIRYLLNTADNKKLKKYLLSYLLEMIRTTLFRQTQFSQFEEFTHSCVEKGIPLTKDSLSNKYLELNKKYYGKAVYSDNEIKYEWARIPHFYRAFYVYKYATGIISALAIADRILTEGDKAVKDYFKFLSSGDSNGPVELLKIAGVDLTSNKPFDMAMEVFRKTLEEYISL